MSASISPSTWVKQVQQSQAAHRISSIRPEDHNGAHEFQFRSARVIQEVVDENEESELESDYIDVTESEEEEIITQVPVEKVIDVYETESASGYTSATPSNSASVSPHYNLDTHGVMSSKKSKENNKNTKNTRISKPVAKPRHRRQSVPILGPRGHSQGHSHGHSHGHSLPQHPHKGNLQQLHEQRTGTHISHHEQRHRGKNHSVESEGEFRSPNAENHPPSTPAMRPPLGSVTEEQKDREQGLQHDLQHLNDLSIHNGSAHGRSLIMDHIEEHQLHTQQRGDKSNKKQNKKPKMSIIQPQALEFDSLVSPAPPSILAKTQQESVPQSTRKRRVTSNSVLSPLAPTRAAHDTPHFSNIHKQMDSVLRFGRSNNVNINVGIDNENEVDGMNGVDAGGMSLDGSGDPEDHEDVGHEEQNGDSRGVSPIDGQREHSQASSLARIQAVTEIGKTTGDICSGLENAFKGLKAIFPSPAISGKPSARPSAVYNGNEDEDEDGDHDMEQHSEPEVEDHVAQQSGQQIGQHPDDKHRGNRSRDSRSKSRSNSNSRSRGKEQTRKQEVVEHEEEEEGNVESEDNQDIGSSHRSPSPSKSKSPPKRRRSARIAKKLKSVISDEELDLSNIDRRSRRNRSRTKQKSKIQTKSTPKSLNNSNSRSRSRSRSKTNKRNKSKTTKNTKGKRAESEVTEQSRYEATTQTDTDKELPPFIADDDDAVLLDDPPLPSTKVKGKKVVSRTKGQRGIASSGGRKRAQPQTQPQTQSRTPSPRRSSDRESEHNNNEEPEDYGNGVLSTVRRRTTRHSMMSAQSNRSMISNISAISGVSSIASNRSRTKTLRSRKDDTLTTPFSDQDDVEEEEEVGTFGTPKSDKTRNRRSRSGGRKKRTNAQKQNRTKSPVSKRQSARNKREMNQSSVSLDHVEVNQDFDDFNDFGGGHDDGGFDGNQQYEQYQDDDDDVAVPFDSPNHNEVAEEKLEIESQRSDESDTPSGGPSKSKKSSSTRTSRSNPTRSKSKSSKTSKKKKGRSQKKAKTDKDKKEKKKKTKKSKSNKTSRRRNRKRKVSDTDLSESPEPDRKRPRLSQVVVKPTSVPPPDPENGTTLRRSKRVRFKPLAFWANERIAPTTEMLTYDTVKESFEKGEQSEIILGQHDELTHFQTRQQKKSKRKRSSKRSGKSGGKSGGKSNGKKNKSKRKRKKKEEESSVEPDSEDEEEVDTVPFDGTAWIYDSVNDNMIQKCVAKTKKCVKLVELAFRPPEEEDENHNGGGGQPANNSVSKVRGAKGLEEESFSCGILEIPPSSEKHPEISFFTEQFFVHKCEAKKLQFKLGDDEFLLSRGSMFFVPPENEYSLRNLSKTHPVQLIFTLIKQKERVEEDGMTQMSQTQLTGSQEY